MDELDQNRFDRITALEPEALSEQDKTFLRARSSYLTKKQEEVYSKVLKAKPEPKVVEDLSPKLRDLKVRANKAGVEHKGLSKPDIEANVRTAEGQAFDA